MDINKKDRSSSFEIPNSIIEKIEKSKNTVRELLSSNCADIQNMDISDNMLDPLQEISEIWEFDIWKNKDGSRFFTIKWLYDVVDWFVWAAYPIIGSWSSGENAFNDFYKKFLDCSDRVRYEDEWYKTFYYDEDKKKFKENYLVVWNTIYQESEKEQLNLITKTSEWFTPYLIKKEGMYYVKNNLLFSDKNKNSYIAWKWTSIEEAFQDFVKNMESGCFFVNGSVIKKKY